MFLLNSFGVVLLVLAGNRYTNREYVTVINESGAPIPEIRFSCNGAGKEIRKLKPGAQKTVFLQPGRHDLLLLKAELRKGPLVRSILLKEQGNGLLAKSRVVIDSSFQWRKISPPQQDQVEACAPDACLQVEGGRLHFDFQSHVGAPCILLLHGRTTTADSYKSAAGDLKRKGYQVLIPELLGYGQSDQPIALDEYHPRKQAQRLLDLLQTLQIDGCHLVVPATGLAWAAEALLLDPESFLSITILDFGMGTGLASWPCSNSDLFGKLLAGALSQPLAARPTFQWLLQGLDGPELVGQADWKSWQRGKGQAFFYWLCNSDYLQAQSGAYQAAFTDFCGAIEVVGPSAGDQDRLRQLSLPDTIPARQIPEKGNWWSGFGPPKTVKK
ncbi:MAG: alpha/beta hydrolase [Phaeodactylibacter sp.]|nr:alpha/beta hydrolase [Phaeodactylibacter sp.]